MSENRRQILDMLAQGKINADEAERLLKALEREPGQATASSEARRNDQVKYLRVVVDAHDDQDGPTKVNIRVPMQLLRAGVKLTSIIPPRARTEVNEALRKEGHRRRHRQVDAREPGGHRRAVARPAGGCRS